MPLSRELIKFRVVLDADEVQREIRFRPVRQKPHARSGLHEAIMAGVVIAFVPRFLDREIEKYVPKIASNTNRSEAEVRVEWNVLREHLRVYDPIRTDDSDAALIDPKDVPYKILSDELGVDAVLTRDRHFDRMGVPVMKETPSGALRDYARASSVSVGLTVGGGCVVALSYASLRVIYAMAERSVQAIVDLPDWAKFILIAGIVVAVVHPTSRRWMSAKWKQCCAAIGSVTPDILNAVETGVLLFLEAQQKTERTRTTLRRALPATRHRTALQMARVILLAHREPLSIAELIIRMQSEGYISSGANFPRYLKRQLQVSGQFIEVGPGIWRLGVEMTLASEPKLQNEDAGPTVG